MSEQISAALERLLDIMIDPKVWMGRRVDAAKAIIEFEVPAAVYELTETFLLGVAEDEDLELAIRALQLLRKVEARRVSPGFAKPDNPMEGLGKRLEEARLKAEAKRKAMN